MLFEEGLIPEEIQETAELAENLDCVGEINAKLMTGVEGFEDQLVIVTGDPFEIASSLDSAQGDNVFRAASDCGLVSCSNYLSLCGIAADEDAVVKFALDNNLCCWDIFGDPHDWGGTTCFQVESILECYGVESSVYTPFESNGSLEGIAEAVESGHAAILGVNAGYLWDDPNYVENGQLNHWVTITGTVRDDSGELVAFTICDSGRGLDSDSCRTVSVSTLEESYLKASYTSVIISDNVVR